MQSMQRTAIVLAVLAALLWSPHFYMLQPLLEQDGVPALVVQFYLLLGPALVSLIILFLTGRTSALAVFNRRETRFLVLSAVGGYGFWMLRALALEATSASQAHLLFYTAPLLMGFLSVVTSEKPDGRTAFALVLGFIGCIMIVQGQAGAAEGAGSAGAWGGSVLAVGAAGCWALFSVLARPIVREESVLPVVVIVTGIGAACLFVTCLSTGVNIGHVKAAQIPLLMLAGLATVGLMMALWLKVIAMIPVPIAAPFWYLGLLFGVFWARRAGMAVSTWAALGGGALIVMGLQSALRGRRRGEVTISDIIRG